MAETEVMRINANTPSTIMTNPPGSLIEISVFAQPRFAPRKLGRGMLIDRL